MTLRRLLPFLLATTVLAPPSLADDKPDEPQRTEGSGTKSAPKRTGKTDAPDRSRDQKRKVSIPATQVRRPTAAPQPARTERRAPSVPRPAVRTPPPPVARPWAGRPAAPPIYRTADHRYARPRPWWVVPSPSAHHAPPRWHWYRPWYTHWWVHPWFRWMHATWVIVHFDFTPDPWGPAWIPPARPGWVWVPGHWEASHWEPGHWEPVARPPTWHGHGYVYVPGWWIGGVYFEGYWRVAERADWVWVPGHYEADGTYVPGHWEPAGPGPVGYVWEPGFWDGETWVEGYWRPAERAGYHWIPRTVDPDGTVHCGYWEPVTPRPGYVWVPGWFDGVKWIPGYWVADQEYQSTDTTKWAPDAGWDQGWEQPEYDEAEEEAPVALPVTAE